MSTDPTEQEIAAVSTAPRVTPAELDSMKNHQPSKGVDLNWLYRLRMLTAQVVMKKCPRCGSSGEIVMNQSADGAIWQLKCGKCECAAPKRKTRLGALSAWVRRASMAMNPIPPR